MNKLIQFTLRNRLLMLVLGALIMGAGYYSYTTLPVDAFPDVSPSWSRYLPLRKGLPHRK